MNAVAADLRFNTLVLKHEPDESNPHRHTFFLGTLKGVTPKRMLLMLVSVVVKENQTNRKIRY
jgi:hypothetical protein